MMQTLPTTPPIPPMTMRNFEDALDRHGAHISAWPEPLRAAATAFVAATPEARRMLEAEQRRASLLGGAMAMQPLSAAALGRLLGALNERRLRDKSLIDLSPRMAWLAAALAIVLFAGGVWTGSHFNDGGDEPALALMTLDDQALLPEDM